MQGLLIDPKLKTVTAIQTDSSADDIYLALGCANIELVMLSPTEALYVDEEGLLQDEPGPFFAVKGFDSPFAGRGFVCGLDGNGKDVSTKMTVPELWALVSFPNIEFIGFEPISGTAHIGAQRVQMAGTRAVFRKREDH